MFVERMEVWQYRQKFEVELSTFPDSTNTKTPRKLLLAWRVCVSAWAKTFVSGYLKKELTDLDENYGTLWVAIGVESRTSPNQYNRTIISP